MRTLGYAVRLFVTVVAATTVMFSLERTTNYPLVGLIAIGVFAIYISVGSLIFKLSTLKIRASYYRNVALFAYPMLVGLAILQEESGVNWGVTWLLFASILIYVVCTFTFQDRWISFLGKAHHSQLNKDVLLFPSNDIKTRDQLIQAEIILNGIAAVSVVYLVIEALSKYPHS